MNWISSWICVFSFRGLFVIDKAGNLRQITINDLPVGRDVDETLRLVQVTIIMMMAMMIFLVAEMLWWSKAHNHQNPASMTAVKKFNFLQAFQFTDEHGEVCPAGWRPGEEPWWWWWWFDGLMMMMMMELGVLCLQTWCLEPMDNSCTTGKATMKPDPKGSQDYFQSAN